MLRLILFYHFGIDFEKPSEIATSNISLPFFFPFAPTLKTFEKKKKK